MDQGRTLCSELLNRRKSLLLQLASLDRLIAIEQEQSDPPQRLIPRRERGISAQSLCGQILAIMNTAPEEVWTCSEITRRIQESDPAPNAYRLPADDLKARTTVSENMGWLWRTGRVRRIILSEISSAANDRPDAIGWAYGP